MCFGVHNDSGDEARVFAINRQGDVIHPEFLPYHGQQPRPGRSPWPGHAIELAAHYDWEDIASDADWLYIADTGNNGNARRDLGIYKVPQFNPRVIEENARNGLYTGCLSGSAVFFPLKTGITIAKRSSLMRVSCT